MKKFLLSMILIATFGFLAKVQAQCTLSNIVVNLNSATPSGANCIIDLDLSFDMENNSGNKEIFINLWKSTDYSFVNFNYAAGGAKGPLLSELNGGGSHPPVAIIGIDNNNAAAVYYTTYLPDPTNITLTTGTGITKTVVGGVAHIQLSHVTFTVPGGCANLVLQGDVWSSQSKYGANIPIHCFTKGVSFFGDPTIGGLVTCTNPRQFQVLLSTVSTTPFTVNYNVYIDNGTVGVKDAADVLAYSNPSTFTISSTTPYNSGLKNYTGNGTKPDADRPLLVEVITSAPFGKTSYGTIDNSCAALPVKLKSFTANRNHSDVELKWTTATEQNNRGFELQKLVGGGGWEKVAFVASKADDGNSSYDLSYSYSDRNTTRGVTQYRLLQTDLDGQFKYSDVRSVRGESQAARMLVFPNPTNNGNVQVVFDEASGSRDVSLMDINGRTVKQWKNVTNNTLQIENLVSGMYNLRVINRQTGEQTIERIIVSKK